MNLEPHILPLNYILHQRYKIISALGQAEFGITYLAFDQQIQQKVCIKELFITGSSTRGQDLSVVSQSTANFSFSDFVDRFMTEAQQLFKLNHPNIIRVMDVFEANRTAYMVMEFVEGETLKVFVENTGMLGFSEVLPLINQLLDAVEVVHKEGMLHRDIKPENILVTSQERLVLIDFGSAREFIEGRTITQTAILTPGYETSTT